MKNMLRILGTLGLLALAISIGTVSASAQLTSALGAGTTVTLTATLPETLTVSITANAAVAFNPATAGVAANPGSVVTSVTTKWQLASTRNAVKLFAWVANNAQALTDGAGDFITAVAVEVTPGGPNASPAGNLNQLAGASGPIPAAPASGMLIMNTAIAAANRNGNSANTLTWNLNLTTLALLPAATYTGTVNLQAQATP